MTAAHYLAVGGGLVAVAVLVVLWLLVTARRRIPLERRRYRPDQRQSALGSFSGRVLQGTDKLLGPRDGAIEEALDLAGYRIRPADFVVLIGSGTVAAFAIGLVLRGAWAGAFLAVLVPIGAFLLLRLRTDRRRRKFGLQLEETLQILSGGLRAGYSLPQSANTVALEAEEPTSTEFARVLNESRVGRPIVEALEDSARRMKSEDYYWIVQAVAINREVGGNLADVLEGVAATIRERVQLKRQVDALAAEGKLSAIILMGLPPAVFGMLMVTNPTYVAAFRESLIGMLMLAAAAVLLTIGGLWLRSLTRIKF